MEFSKLVNNSHCDNIVVLIYLLHNNSHYINSFSLFNDLLFDLSKIGFLSARCSRSLSHLNISGSSIRIHFSYSSKRTSHE